jgi:hypothetical protein
LQGVTLTEDNARTGIITSNNFNEQQRDLNKEGKSEKQVTLRGGC